MKVLKGKTTVDFFDFDKITEGYNSIIVDIGTGNGRFVYKNAKKNPDIFYVGIDPVSENMAEYASKSIKKPSKGGISNALYVVAAAEEMPRELYNKADKIYVNLPWGSLLEGVVKGNPVILNNIVNISKPSKAHLEIWFTYNDLHEAGEISRRNLPSLSVEYIEKTLFPIYQSCGIDIFQIDIVDNEDLKEFDTQWSKRLGFGRARDVFRIKAVIKK
ncbi:methyltransferase domain-containing protein [Acetivibrio saccincola]|uniref:16S rRNA (Adenine(1408)-N(1))-methyltransferase n=1 Tax=Acetivibrio saccincola TaxID=1677857 RepID=A0A2K9EIG4_9FIRM|nr:methyltransferase domain-containing protein [Acetivibrio saccincola]AUG59025.1 16S rRNA (adenine(1408)-N(1))-methyltransferase [Acetivibrio saccincola]NLW28042.1 16S rRNA (adenine(1408)-N(1))-methyltransferase NpmA [Acetivibrio saccincola]HOA96708.1 16S rRNA (adenine(1408)-N(1))-methyltransferase NpmA [Acetivibrio saccincola]HQD28834.1 16S rRNA (adenine(1408)-N(1))-methyltransferase NpmA [Acetivibrio saccincola]